MSTIVHMEGTLYPVLSPADFDPLAAQPGMLDPSVLFQDAVWVDRDARVHYLSEMPQDYRQNLIDFLRQRAALLQSRVVLHVLLTSSKLLHEDLQTVLGPDATAPDEAERWLENTPLMQALLSMTPPRCEF